MAESIRAPISIQLAARSRNGLCRAKAENGDGKHRTLCRLHDSVDDPSHFDIDILGSATPSRRDHDEVAPFGFCDADDCPGGVRPPNADLRGKPKLTERSHH